MDGVWAGVIARNVHSQKEAIDDCGAIGLGTLPQETIENFSAHGEERSL